MIALYVVLQLWVFWALFVLVMGMYRAWLAKRLGRLAIALSLPWIVIGLALDFAANCSLAIVLFVDLPHELLVTRRLRRYILQGSGWRRDVAVWVCENLLDPFDPTGDHC